MDYFPTAENEGKVDVIRFYRYLSTCGLYLNLSFLLYFFKCLLMKYF